MVTRLTFKDTAKLFSKVGILHSHQQCRGFSFSTSWSILDLVHLFYFNHSNGCGVYLIVFYFCALPSALVMLSTSCPVSILTILDQKFIFSFSQGQKLDIDKAPSDFPTQIATHHGLCGICGFSLLRTPPLCPCFENRPSFSHGDPITDNSNVADPSPPSHSGMETRPGYLENNISRRNKVIGCRLGLSHHP